MPENRIDARKIGALVPFSNPNAYFDGQSLGIGVVKAPGVVGAGGSVTISHKLGRKPNYVQVLSNGTASFKGDCYIQSHVDTNNCVVVYEMAQVAGAFTWLV